MLAKSTLCQLCIKGVHHKVVWTKYMGNKGGADSWGGGDFLPGGIFFRSPRGAGGGYKKKLVLQKIFFLPMSHIIIPTSAMHVVRSIVNLCCNACYGKGATDSYMSQMACRRWASTLDSPLGLPTSAKVMSCHGWEHHDYVCWVALTLRVTKPPEYS